MSERAGTGRRLILVLGGVAVALGLAVAGVQVATDRQGTGAVTTTAGCGEVITKPLLEQALHATTAAPIDYPDAPPAFGNHWPVPVAFGRPFYAEDRPRVEELVHNLEHGYTIAWYDETAASDAAAMAELADLARYYQDSSERFIAAPWFASDGARFPEGTHVALTRWSADPSDHTDISGQRGNWMYCGTVDRAAITTFFETWPNASSAEPNLY